MKKFIIERNLPGAGNLTPEELQMISEASCGAIGDLGQPYHWIQSYITNDRIYCVHIAESEAVVREHAKLGKFPINTVNEVITIIDPVTSTVLKK
jgi:Nickel responsive protein SCO4226-like